MKRLAALASFVLFLASGEARGECLRAPDVDPGESEITRSLLREDRVGRPVTPVYINGEGPYSFIVDTGANRSVLSLRLAERLGVTAFGTGQVHTIDSVETAPFVRVATLSAGAMHLANVEMPLIDGDVLAGRHGLLGIDGLTGRRLLLDFQHRCVEIADARTAPPIEGWIAVPGRLQPGSSLFIMDGSVGDVRVTILIDTGASHSLANTAFREALRPYRATTVQWHGDFLFTAGKPLVSQSAIWAPRIRIGSSAMTSVRAFIGDFHIFDYGGLAETPTLLVGMDVLARSRAMAIDYRSQIAYFRRPPRGSWRDLGTTTFSNR